jgi:hypothetical protein
MTTTTIPTNLHIEGNLTLTGSYQKVDSGDILNQKTLESYLIPWTAWRVWDAVHTNLPGTAANDDLALVGGTFGTDTWCVESGDLKAAGATTRYARAFIQLPPEYEDGQTVNIRVRGGMETTVADNSATVDLEVYESDYEGDAAGPTDLCATAAQSINSLTHADKDFTITATGLAAGDWLDVRLAVAVNDAATGTVVLARVGNVNLLCDVIL